MNKRHAAAITAILLAAVLAVAGCSAPQGEGGQSGQEQQSAQLIPVPQKGSDTENPGYPAADFTLTDMDGNTYTLSDYAGQKIHLKFWASWCSVCLAGMPETEQLASEEKDFQFWTIVSPGNFGEKDKEDFIEWYKGLGNEHLIVLFDETGEVMENYGIRAFPTSAYIGTDGILVKTLPGHNTNDVVRATVEAIK